MLDHAPNLHERPSQIRSRLEMARRLVDSLTSAADRREVQAYISELERQLDDIRRH